MGAAVRLRATGARYSLPLTTTLLPSGSMQHAMPAACIADTLGSPPSPSPPKSPQHMLRLTPLTPFQEPYEEPIYQLRPGLQFVQEAKVRVLFFGCGLGGGVRGKGGRASRPQGSFLSAQLKCPKMQGM